MSWYERGKINMELTQEQLDQMLADAKKGLFSEDELNRRVTSEVDRRVESGIQKGLETHKQKWEQDFISKSKMTADELAQKQIQEKMDEFNRLATETNKKSNLIDARELLSEANIPKSHYNKFINMLVSDNKEGTIANVNNFINMFNETKTELETGIKSQYINVPPPSGTTGQTTLTKADFLKMSYVEKMKLKAEKPEVFKALMTQ